MAIKLFIYPHAEPHVHDAMPEFVNTIPFSARGIAEHCEIVGPHEADYFYMGQVKDTEAWKLHPNRWQFFKGNESRHILDLEGDWRDFDHPEWLAESVITTGHARIESQPRFERRFVRPVMSPLLMRLVKNPPEWKWPEVYGFWFQGQRDSRGLRVKVEQALKLADVPHEFSFNDQWGCYWGEDDERVRSYYDNMKKWAFALCPVGEGPTCRFYEACLFGRLPVLIGDYLICGESSVGIDFPPRPPTDMPVEKMVIALREISRVCSSPVAPFAPVKRYRDDVLLPYFKAPTVWLLERLEDKAHA